jgi:hypothetical protein
MLRTAILREAGVAELTEKDARSMLAPETFMAAVGAAGVDIENWLRTVLAGGEPNAVHVVLAQLLSAGSVIWTVNFDELIETAAKRLWGQPPVAAWPQPPNPNARLLKPHGTLGGEGLIVRSDQVVNVVAPNWAARLKTDAENKTVLIIGYRGYDIDLAPTLDDAFVGARQILWFDFPFDESEEGETAHTVQSESIILEHEWRRRMRLLQQSIETHEVVFVPCPQNPSRDFVDWVVTHGLVAAPDPALLAALDTPVPPAQIEGPAMTLFARAMVRDVLGEHRAARKALRQVVRETHDWRTAKALIDHYLNHGGVRLARSLVVTRLVPPVTPRLRAFRVRMRRKRITIYQRTGRYRAVLRLTKRRLETDTSTEISLRSAGLRVAGRLDESIDVGSDAVQLGRRESHPSRLVHDIFQLAMAFTWAGRVDEADLLIERELKPLAELTNVRWVGWYHYLAASVALLRQDASSAHRNVAIAVSAFEAEAHINGIVSALANDLIVATMARDSSLFRTTRDRLAGLLNGVERIPEGWLYMRKSFFRDRLIDFHDAEFLRVVKGDKRQPAKIYRRLRHSRYSIHRLLGTLGEAEISDVPSQRLALAREAADIALKVGARKLVAHAQSFPAMPGDVARQILFTP